MLGKSKKITIPLSLAISFYALAISVNRSLSKPKIEVDKQDSAININTTFLKVLSVGNKRFFSDIIWIYTLLESDNEHYKKKDLNSWMYIRFNNIAELDPLFYENYIWGGVYLSIIKDDRLGAANIFEKGLKVYPDDYDLNYHAGFNYYAQLANYKRAYELLSKIQHYPKAPAFFPTLIAKIRFQEDFDYDGTITFLVDQYKIAKDEMVKEKISKNIYAIKAEKDLKCLNEIKNNCDLKDAEGTPYKKTKNGYSAAKTFLPYRFHFNQQ